MDGLRSGLLSTSTMTHQSTVAMTPTEFSSPDTYPEWNLGKMLRITEEIIDSFSYAATQSIPLITIPILNYLHDNQTPELISMSTKDLSFSGVVNGTNTNGFGLDGWMFEKAEEVVKIGFGGFGVEMDLHHTRHHFFTCDMIVSHQKRKVLAVQEFVVMKDYLWVESLVVLEEVRRSGLGFCTVLIR